MPTRLSERSFHLEWKPLSNIWVFQVSSTPPWDFNKLLVRCHMTIYSYPDLAFSQALKSQTNVKHIL